MSLTNYLSKSNVVFVGCGTIALFTSYLTNSPNTGAAVGIGCIAIGNLVNLSSTNDLNSIPYNFDTLSSKDLSSPSDLEASSNLVQPNNIGDNN